MSVNLTWDGVIESLSSLRNYRGCKVEESSPAAPKTFRFDGNLYPPKTSIFPSDFVPKPKLSSKNDFSIRESLRQISFSCSTEVGLLNQQESLDKVESLIIELRDTLSNDDIIEQKMTLVSIRDREVCKRVLSTTEPVLPDPSLRLYIDVRKQVELEKREKNMEALQLPDPALESALHQHMKKV